LARRVESCGANEVQRRSDEGRVGDRDELDIAGVHGTVRLHDDVEYNLAATSLVAKAGWIPQRRIRRAQLERRIDARRHDGGVGED